VATPEIARMIVSEIGRQVQGHAPKTETDDVDIITIKTKTNILKAAQQALSKQVQI
jgi:hypothetical protein